MSVFVQRREGVVTGVFAILQPGIADEELADDHPDVVAYRNPPPPPLVVVLYPVDLWSRLTETEAEQVEAAIAAQPVRLRNIFKAASSYRSDHELWPLLDQVANQLFGAERAAVILAGSVS